MQLAVISKVISKNLSQELPLGIAQHILKSSDLAY